MGAVDRCTPYLTPATRPTPHCPPQAFPEWGDVMDTWGAKLLAAAHTVAAMLARGLDLPHDAFVSRMHLGPHLLAPTASDLGQHNTVCVGGGGRGGEGGKGWSPGGPGGRHVHPTRWGSGQGGGQGRLEIK